MAEPVAQCYARILFVFMTASYFNVYMAPTGSCRDCNGSAMQTLPQPYWLKYKPILGNTQSGRPQALTPLDRTHEDVTES